MNDKKRRTADTTGNQQAETSDWNTVEKPADVSACHTMTKDMSSQPPTVITGTIDDKAQCKNCK